MEKSIHTPEYRILAATLRRLREVAGLSQVDLAERIGENQVFVSRYETAQTRLDYLQLRTICMALGTNIASFNQNYERRLRQRTRKSP